MVPLVLIFLTAVVEVELTVLTALALAVTVVLLAVVQGDKVTSL